MNGFCLFWAMFFFDLKNDGSSLATNTTLPLTGAWFGKGKHLVGSDGHLSNISLLFVLSGNHKSG
jgi:hypothetical protein